MKKLINKSRLTLFMKGNEKLPKCGKFYKISIILFWAKMIFFYQVSVNDPPDKATNHFFADSEITLFCFGC